MNVIGALKSCCRNKSEIDYCTFNFRDPQKSAKFKVFAWTVMADRATYYLFWLFFILCLTPMQLIFDKYTFMY